jgi:imidazolonepropionase-like amidohydrolase
LALGAMWAGIPYVSVGAKADLVVVAGDLVADLSLLLGQGEHISMVIKAGVCVKHAGQLLKSVAA